MTRHTLLRLIPTALLQLQTEPVDLGIDFASKYNNWILERNESINNGTVSATEIRLWPEVIKAFKRLESAIHYE